MDTVIAADFASRRNQWSGGRLANVVNAEFPLRQIGAVPEFNNQLLRHCGARFSLKAVTPSTISSVVKANAS